MVNAGFNPLEEIAHKTGKSIGELKEEMSKGAITSKMVQDAFISATSAGGKFFGMSSEGAKTLNGQISMLGESFDMMFNEIGSKGEGVVMSAVQAGTYLVENYQTIGKVLLGLIETYGVYKTALVVDAALKGGLVAAESASIVVKKLHTAVTWGQTAAQTALNTVMLMNPYVAVGAALIALCGAIYTFTDTTSAATEAQKHLNEANDEVEKSTAKEIKKLDGLCEVLETTKKGSKEWKAAKDAIISQYGKYDRRLAAEIERTGTLTSSYNDLADAIRRSIAARQLKQFYDTTVKDSEDRKQGNRKIIYDKISSEYGRQTTRLLMQNIAEYERTKDESIWQRVLWHKKKGGKRQRKTVRQMLLDTGVYDASQIFKAIGDNVREDKAVRESTQDYLDMNNLTWGDYNETVYGIKKPSKTPPKSDNSNNNWKQEVKTARSEWQKAHKEVLRLKKAKGATVKQIQDAQAKEKAASDAYKKLTDTTPEQEYKVSPAKTNSRPHKIPKQNNTDDDALRAAEEAARKREEVFKRGIASQEKIDSERIKAAEAAEEERIAKIPNDGERERAEYQLQYDKTIRQIQKQAADMQKAKYEENKKEWELHNTDKTKVYSDTEEGKKGYREIELSQDQKNYIQSSIRKIDIEYSNQKKKWAEVQKNALTSYLKEYGTFEEKKLAITQEYEEKIRKAGSVGEKATLEMQRDKEIEKAKNDNLQSTIDWNGIFSNLQGHTKQYLQGLRNQLQELLNTGNLPIDQMQTVSEKINAIDDELGKQQGIWDFVGERTREHNRLLKEAADAQERLNKARKDEAEEASNVNTVKQDVQKELSKNGLEYDIKDISTASLNGKIDLTDKKFSGMAPLLQKLAVAEGRLTEARKKTIDATNKAKQAEDGAKEKEADKVARWFSGKQDFIKSKGIDQIPDLLESVGLGSASEKAQNGLDAFNNAAGAAEDFASGNYVGAALKGLSAIKSFASVVGIGGDSDPHLEEDIERLTSSNEALKDSIDSLSEEMKKGAVANAYDIYEEQKKHLIQSEKNTQEMMERSAGAYKSGFGGKHSSASYIDRGLSGTDYWQQISRLLGKNITNAGNFFNLSSEEMAKVAKDLPEIYAQIKLLAKAGYKDAAQFMDDYIGYYKQLEELGSQVEEKLTSSSFDSIVGDFESALMDMDSDMETFADNFENYMRKAVIGALVSNQYKPMIEQWYKAFANFMETDKKLTPDEIKKLKEQGGSYIDKETGKEVKFSSWNDIVSSGLNTKNALLDQLGLGSANQSQKATINEERNLSEDTGSQIVGRLTAVQIAVESGNNKRDNANERLSLMNMKLEDFKSIQVQSNNIADETRTILANSYLELKSINNNTGKSAIHLQEIQGDIKDLKKIMDDKL